MRKDGDIMDNEVKEGTEATTEQTDNCGKAKKQSSLKTKMLWSLVFVAIAVLTVWAITSQEGFTLASFIGFLRAQNPMWITFAIAAMLAYVLFEALALMTIIKSFGYKAPIHRGLIYSSSDIYFSAITPSATGGQPASAYFMMKDGIPGAVTTVALILNLVMYTFAILIIGTVSFIVRPGIFLGFPVVGKVLIIVGSICLVSLAIFFIMILFKSHILSKIGNACLTLLSKLHIIRNVDRKREKLACSIKSYNGYVEQLKGKQKSIVLSLLFNILQRVSVILVTVCVFMASGGDFKMCWDIAVCQCMVILGTNVLPIPGAMGISDYMLICAFSAIGFSETVALNLNLVSRGISFYSCVIICGISLIVRLISYKVIALRKQKKIKNTDQENQK